MPWLHGWRMSVWSCIRTRHAWCTARTPTGVTIMRLRRSRSWATRSVPDWPKPGGGSISLTSSPRSARTRSRRWGGRYGPGTSLGAVTSPSPTWHGWSTASCTVGSTTTAASTSRCCIPSCGASTIIWCAGPAGNTNGCADANGKRNSSWPASRDASQVCSRTGASASNLMAGRWEPCKPRGFRTVLRAAGGAIPPADSPRRVGSRHSSRRRGAAGGGGGGAGADGARPLGRQDRGQPHRRGLRLLGLPHPAAAQARQCQARGLHLPVEEGARRHRQAGPHADQTDSSSVARRHAAPAQPGAARLVHLLQTRRLQSDLRLPRRVHLASSSPLGAAAIPQDEVGRPLPPLLPQLAAHRGRGDAVPTADGSGQPVPLAGEQHPRTMGDDRDLTDAYWLESVESPVRGDAHAGFGGRAGETRRSIERWRAPARPDSSTQTTTAFSGGCRYNPTTSRTFASSSGSVEKVNVSTRHGCSFHFRQIRATVAKETPRWVASSRADQCVTPSFAGGGSNVATTTATSSCTGGRPDRARSSNAAAPPA